MPTTLIIFTGLPGTGKTSLSRKIANSLCIPLVAKDDIKEIMYDTIGWSDKAFSTKLAHATFGIMDYIVEQHIKNEMPLVLESNFSPKLASERFQNWQKEYGCTILQIVCRTEIDTLAGRYYQRQLTDRHPGHTDNGTAADYRINFKQRIENNEDQPLNVDGPVRIVDTTDFSLVNVQEIELWLREHLSNHLKAQQPRHI